ncbi:MAG: hypothetical protein JWM95_1571, partial [Gemmatimonadetes bacterium]|nr:hypothetical protein [Gemmatimonadota bacterium]
SGAGVERAQSRMESIVALLSSASQEPGTVGIKAMRRDEQWPTSELKALVRMLSGWSELLISLKDKPRMEQLAAIKADAVRRLEEAAAMATNTPDDGDAYRLQKVLPLTVLFALHARLEPYRRHLRRSSGHANGGDLPDSRAEDERLRKSATLLSEIESVLERYA